MNASIQKAPCYLSNDRGAIFLRIESPRERIALPYSTLLAITVSIDETILELDFASHKVTLNGTRLYEVYCSISSGQCSAIIAKYVAEELLLAPENKEPFIADIRIKVSSPL